MPPAGGTRSSSTTSWLSTAKTTSWALASSSQRARWPSSRTWPVRRTTPWSHVTRMALLTRCTSTSHWNTRSTSRAVPRSPMPLLGCTEHVLRTMRAPGTRPATPEAKRRAAVELTSPVSVTTPWSTSTRMPRPAKPSGVRKSKRSVVAGPVWPSTSVAAAGTTTRCGAGCWPGRSSWSSTRRTPATPAASAASWVFWASSRTWPFSVTSPSCTPTTTPAPPALTSLPLTSRASVRSSYSPASCSRVSAAGVRPLLPWRRSVATHRAICASEACWAGRARSSVTSCAITVSTPEDRATAVYPPIGGRAGGRRGPRDPTAEGPFPAGRRGPLRAGASRSGPVLQHLVDDPRAAAPVLAQLDQPVPLRVLEQAPEAVVAVVLLVELRLLALDGVLHQGALDHVLALALQRGNGLHEQREGLLLHLGQAARGLHRRAAAAGGPREVVVQDELVAVVDEQPAAAVLHADADDVLVVLAQLAHQRGEVAVAAHQREGVDVRLGEG